MAVDVPSAYRTLGYSRPVLKSIDANALTATAILTFPEVDYAGDYVVPDGGDWESEFKANPRVRLEHTRKIGTGAVQLVPTDIDGQTYNLPVGTTTFDPNDRISAQVFRLVSDDVMTGVSLEFTPASPTSYKSMGYRSALEDRNAMRFDKWIALGWGHCMAPVCPNARTVLPGIEKAFRCVDTGKIGDELLDPVILKSLSVHLPGRPVQITVPRTVEASVATEPTPPPSGFHPLAVVGYDATQGIADIAGYIRKSVKYLEGKDALLKIADDLDAIAEESAAVADTKDTDETVEKALDVKPLEFDDDRIIVTKSAYKPRRFAFVGGTLQAVAEDAENAEVEALLREADADNRATRSTARRIERTTTRRGRGR